MALTGLTNSETGMLLISSSTLRPFKNVSDLPASGLYLNSILIFSNSLITFAASTALPSCIIPFSRQYKVTARYMAPVSIYAYPSVLASSRATVLLPHDEYPSIAIVISRISFCGYKIGLMQGQGLMYWLGPKCSTNPFRNSSETYIFLFLHRPKNQPIQASRSIQVPCVSHSYMPDES